MARQPWTEALSQTNRALVRDGVALMGQPVRLKVRHKPLDDGSRAIDAYGLFDGAAKVTTRSTGISLTPGTYEVRLPEAVQQVRRLVEQTRLGEDTRAPRGWRNEQVLPAAGALARQMHEVRRVLTSRSENLGRCRPRQLKDQLRWMAICEQRAQQEGRELSMGLCLRALRDHYGGVDRSAYKKAVSIVRVVCQRLGLPDQLPEELTPRHRPSDVIRAIPSDALICERLKAIADPDEAREIYAVVAYGRRVAEIYYADWGDLRSNGYLMVYGSKTNKRGWSWPMPFGDEEIDLQGFRPRQWDALACVGKRPDPAREQQIRIQSSRISRLIQQRLGCSATDLRHRWGSVCLVDPRFARTSLDVIASAMCTSRNMLEKTYAREMPEYVETQLLPLLG